MMELIDEARKHGNPNLSAALVLNEARTSTSMAGAAEEALAHVQGAHFLGHVGLRQAFVEAFAAGRVVSGGPALQEIETVLHALAKLLKR
jgi:hypothetical protein